MQGISITAFEDELEKIAALGHDLADIAGLGVLAAPTLAKKFGKPMKEKTKDNVELGGLGVLGGAVAHEHRHAIGDFAKKVVTGKGRAAWQALRHA